MTTFVIVSLLIAALRIVFNVGALRTGVMPTPPTPTICAARVIGGAAWCGWAIWLLATGVGQ